MTEKKDDVAQAAEPERLDLRSHDIAEDRYLGMVKMIYIDPPYNKGPFLPTR